MSLVQKTVTGLIWSFVESLSGFLIRFLTGIILARILSPDEFGLIGMTVIFINISLAFIDSGMSQALIRKQNCSSGDYSTVFYFNLAVSLAFYAMLFVGAPWISLFFDEPKLNLILRILGLGLIISSLGIIPITRLKKEVDFKQLTVISVISSLVSGSLAVYLAIRGVGVWSLVVLSIAQQFLTTVLLLIRGSWKPFGHFSRRTLREHYSFGSKLFLSGLIDTVFSSAYLMIIGKFYSTAELGFYSKAQGFSSLPSTTLQTSIARVTYPVLSRLQDDIPRLKEAYQRIIRSTMFFSFPLMLGLAAIAKPMVLALIGAKWEGSIVYIQLLCLSGMLYPLLAINLNVFKVLGRSDLLLRLEVLKKIWAIPVILAGIFIGIKEMLVALILYNIFSLYINTKGFGKFINYSFLAQLKDISSSFILALVTASFLYFEGRWIPFLPYQVLIIQVFSGFLVVITLGELIRQRDYIYLKTIAKEKLKQIRDSHE